ncbi:hypothetical protein HB959_06600 [Yersinia aleksiciae]|nr:hypothetical protein [Yersinia aleksiciae]
MLLGVLNKKFSVKNRVAIAKALASVDRSQMANNLAKFSKAFLSQVKSLMGLILQKKLITMWIREIGGLYSLN